MMNWAEVRAINSDLTKPLNKVIDEGIEGLQEVVDSIYIEDNYLGEDKGKIINNYVHDPFGEWEVPNWFGNFLMNDSATGSVTGYKRIVPIIHDNEIYLFDHTYESEFGTSDDYYYFHIYKYDGKDQFEILRGYQSIGSKFNFSNGRIVQVNNNDIYLIQSNGDNNTKYFYKFDWDRFGFYQSLTTPPLSPYQSQYIVFDGELHVLSSHWSGGSYQDVKKHYKWNGSSWREVSTLPIDPGTSYTFTAVVYNNTLYLLGGNTLNNNGKKVYKFIPGTSAETAQWVLEETMEMPSSVASWDAQWLVYKNKLYLTSVISEYKILTWDGTTWSYSTPACSIQEPNNSQTYLNTNHYAFVYNDLLYFFNVYNSHTNYNRIVTFDGEKFTYHIDKIELSSREFKIPGQDKSILMEHGDVGVKSVQTGFISNCSTSWQEIYINPVNPNKTLVYIAPWAMSNGNYYIRAYVTGDRFHYYNNYTSGIGFQWTIIEFY